MQTPLREVHVKFSSSYQLYSGPYLQSKWGEGFYPFSILVPHQLQPHLHYITSNGSFQYGEIIMGTNTNFYFNSQMLLNKIHRNRTYIPFRVVFTKNVQFKKIINKPQVKGHVSKKTSHTFYTDCGGSLSITSTLDRSTFIPFSEM